MNPATPVISQVLGVLRRSCFSFSICFILFEPQKRKVFLFSHPLRLRPQRTQRDTFGEKL